MLAVVVLVVGPMSGMEGLWGIGRGCLVLA